MPKAPLPRLLLALGLALLFLLLLIAILLATDVAFRVWGHLEASPAWFALAYAAGIALLGIPFGIGIWRLLGRRKSPPPPPPGRAAPSEESLQERLTAGREMGLDTAGAEASMALLHRDRAAGIIRVALFGEISSGKSSLAAALIPGSTISRDVTGGTTRRITEYRWSSPAGDELILVDMPGLNEADGTLDEQSRNEALRSHVVIYLCEGDLTRDQFRELDALLALGKPTILALNKSDRYGDGELTLLRQRLATRAERVNAIVAVRSGGEQRVLRVEADGSEHEEIRPRPPRLEELQRALQRLIDDSPAMLEQLRDSSLFVLIARQLDQAEARHRREKADQIVSDYAKKAVIGALAAVTPGTDLVIQGYLGTRMIGALTALYQVPLRRIDSETLIDLAQQHLGKKHTLLLALAGNALKAFPGLGTLTGGVLHAAAYGMIFDSLGRAVADSLEQRGELHPLPVATRFKEYLGEDMESTAQRIARLVAREADDRAGNG